MELVEVQFEFFHLVSRGEMEPPVDPGLVMDSAVEVEMELFYIGVAVEEQELSDEGDEFVEAAAEGPEAEEDGGDGGPEAAPALGDEGGGDGVLGGEEGKDVEEDGVGEGGD